MAQWIRYKLGKEKDLCAHDREYCLQFLGISLMISLLYRSAVQGFLHHITFTCNELETWNVFINISTVSITQMLLIWRLTSVAFHIGTNPVQPIHLRRRSPTVTEFRAFLHIWYWHWGEETGLQVDSATTIPRCSCGLPQRCSLLFYMGVSRYHCSVEIMKLKKI